MSRVYDAIMGLVVGDALGVPVEFQKRDSYHVTDMIGYGSHCQPPGTWSDDSSMTLATVHWLAFRRKAYDLHSLMNRFAAWLRTGQFTPLGRVFDVGGTTSAAINRWHLGTDIASCGGSDIRDNGNGALMRILPMALVDCDDHLIDGVSGLTHAHEISKAACRIYVHAARRLLQNEPLQAILKDIDVQLPDFWRLPFLADTPREDIKSTGYVVDTLEAAFWCVLHGNSYRECVLLAVNLGDDTDTVAAVAGGLAGIIYGIGGERGIPEEWIDKIANKDWIKSLCERFESKYTPA